MSNDFDWSCPLIIGGCGKTWPKDAPPQPEITDLSAYRECPECGGPVMKRFILDNQSLNLTRTVH